MKNLDFTEQGLCRIKLDGLPQPEQIHALIESYVTEVELLPHTLRMIFLDISRLVHMQASTRKVFSELLVQASRHYSGKILLVIAGGPPMIRKYIEILCKALGFKQRIHSFADLADAARWIENWFGNQPSDS